MMSDIEKFKKVLTDLERKPTDAKAQRTKADEALRRGYSAHDANPRDSIQSRCERRRRLLSDWLTALTLNSPRPSAV
jgi:hypothetical protein